MKLLELFKKDDIGEMPWGYHFLYNLPPSEYPKYLKKIFYYRTEENLPLKREKGNYIIDKNKCKTFNQKIQWLKLNGVTSLIQNCTDKIKVRDFVKDKIGEEYLKPVLQICDTFDEINFDNLPDKFVIKCNHGCKWHCIIKDKQKLLSTKRAFEKLRKQMTGWLEQEFWCWEGFELQYKGLEHRILIEDYMPANRYIEIFCFDGVPRIYSDIQLKGTTRICTYNEDFSFSDLILKEEDEQFMNKFSADETLKQAVELSKKLAKDFKFVRVDWMIPDCDPSNQGKQDKLHFEELTFTAYSGFSLFNETWNKKLGDWIEI